MAATFGVGSLPSGASAPANTAVKTTSVKESVETYQYRDETGVTKKLIAGKLKTTEVTLDVIGSPSLAAVAAGAFAGALGPGAPRAVLDAAAARRERRPRAPD